MKKKAIVVSTIIFLFIGCCILYYFHQKPTKWDYEGTAVVLSNSNSGRAFLGMTDVSICLECYGFGKYFLGDIRASIIEKEKHFYGEPDDTKGMMTDYRFCRNQYGEDFFKVKKNRDRFRMETMEARTFWHRESIPNTKMLLFDWIERFGKQTDLEYMVTAYFHFNMAGSPFVIETHDYLIVPGVSTREEAIAFLQENYPYIDWIDH